MTPKLPAEIEQAISDSIGEFFIMQDLRRIRLSEIIAGHIAPVLAEQQAELDDAELRLQTLEDWRRETKHLCACEHDQHGGVCGVHAPKIQQLQNQLNAAKMAIDVLEGDLALSGEHEARAEARAYEECAKHFGSGGVWISNRLAEARKRGGLAAQSAVEDEEAKS